MKLARIVGFTSSVGVWLTLASGVIAQSATSSAAPKGGGTSSALPSAGTTEWTYLIFLVGALLFVFGMIKFVLSFRE